MAAVSKIQSNITATRYSEELSPNVPDPSAVWKLVEPNSFSDFGAQTTLVARTPITDGRQRKKGVIVDLEASGGFNTDVTLTNLQDLGQGFFFADLRRKGEGVISSIDGATEKIELDHAMNMFVGSLILVANADTASNNGLKRITAVNSVFATGTYTLSANVANNDTVTIGTTVYTFKTTLTGAANEILIGGTASISIDNLIAAINAAAGEGTLYGTDTAAHTLVSAAAGAGDTMTVTALLDGPSGNSIATTEVGANSSFGAGTLTGGDADVTVAEDLTTETPTGTATVVVVGFQFASADATITATGGNFPVLGATAKNLTQLCLIPGEYLFLGGDAAATTFATAADAGFARVRSITATAITFDKTAAAFVTDAGTGKTIQVFLGRVLKNETGTNIVTRTYQIERTLGASNDTNPTELQAEYLEEAYANELAIVAAPAAKLLADMSFVASHYSTVSSGTALKAGTRPDLVDSDALNTANDITRIKLASVVDGNAVPTALFAFATDLTITINNGVTPDKALGVLGANGVSIGDFAVSGSIDAYFADVASVEAVQQNSDITIEVHYVKANAGITMDLPLIALGDARLTVEKDKSIKIPLSMEAATAAAIDPDLNHTALFIFWDYLPDVADA